MLRKFFISIILSLFVFSPVLAEDDSYSDGVDPSYDAGFASSQQVIENSGLNQSSSDNFVMPDYNSPDPVASSSPTQKKNNSSDLSAIGDEVDGDDVDKDASSVSDGQTAQSTATQKQCYDSEEETYGGGETLDCAKVSRKYKSGIDAVCDGQKGTWDISKCAVRQAPDLIGGTLLPGVSHSKEAMRNDASGWLQNVFLRNVIDILIGLTASIAVIFIILGGYQYLTAFGNEEQVKQGHKTMTWGLVGVFLAVIAFAIVQIIINIDFGGGLGSGNESSYSDSANADSGSENAANDSNGGK